MVFSSAVAALKKAVGYEENEYTQFSGYGIYRALCEAICCNHNVFVGKYNVWH